LYLTTDDNVADDPPRNKDLKNARIDATLECLQRAEASARGMWSYAGNATSGASCNIRPRED